MNARRLLILVTAAEDLAEGVRHDGPRAFSQAHFGDTRRADDVAQVLREAQVPTWVLLELGVARSPYLGLVGPLLVSAEGATINVGVLWGPELLRSDQPGLRVELKAPGVPLLVVENLQAAEAVCDRFPAVAVAYTSGLAGAATLALIGSLASQAGRLILIPDANLGGVRIAEQVVSVVAGAELVDIGRFPHRPQDPFVRDGLAIRQLHAHLSGPAGALASAVLERGYPVEQQLATVAAVRTCLMTASPEQAC